MIANINSSKEAVIGGTTAGVEKAIAAVRDAGFVARPLQVSHAFHTRIVAPAGESLTKILGTMNLCPPEIPIITNVAGEFYPMGPDVVPEMIGLLGRQVYSPVQFIKGLNTLYNAGARVFVEIGPKRILYGFVEDVLGDREGVVALFTNHPRIGDAASVNLALCGLYAAGLGVGRSVKEPAMPPAIETREERAVRPAVPAAQPAIANRSSSRVDPRPCRREPPICPWIGTRSWESSSPNSWIGVSRSTRAANSLRRAWIFASRARPWACRAWMGFLMIPMWNAFCAAMFSSTKFRWNCAGPWLKRTSRAW